MSALLKLYVKSWCPWCICAKQFLDQRGYRYEEIDVERDRVAFDEMIRISGQHRAPTLVVGEKLLADFGPDELADFLKKNEIQPEIQK